MSFLAFFEQLGETDWSVALHESEIAYSLIESFHVLSLCLFFGMTVMFDLRLLGIGKRIPIAALHKLIPWGLTGFAINITSGSLFLLTEPDQYIYNPSFQFKVLFIMLAGANALTFYATSWGRATADNAIPDASKLFVKLYPGVFSQILEGTEGMIRLPGG